MTLALETRGFASTRTSPAEAGLAARLVRALRFLLAQRRAARALVALDDRLLRDIGLERDEIAAAARRAARRVAG